MAKFRAGDFIKCSGKHFSEREVQRVTNTKYITRFLEDDSVVESDITITDSIYFLKVMS